MRRALARTFYLTTVLLLPAALQVTLPSGPAAADSCQPPLGARLLAPGPVGSSPAPEGAELCIAEAGPACFGCESGYVHRCIAGTWRPLPNRACAMGEGRSAPADSPDRYPLDTASYRSGMDRADRSRRAPTGGAVPFRHCRYYDADGRELRVPPEEAAQARRNGLIDWQRCETVWCRLYSQSGEPLSYASDDQDLVEADIRAGRVSVRASECRPQGGSDRAAALAESWPDRPIQPLPY